MKYNYVFYGATNSFLKNTFSDLEISPCGEVKGDFLESENKILQIMFKIHTYPQFNRFFSIPFKGIWLNKCFKFKFNDNKPICFIVGDKYYNQDFFFDYLRKKYDDCKIVITFRDLYLSKKKRFPDMNIEELKEKFDLVMSYDKGDCKKYNLVYFDLEATKKYIDRASDYPWSDVIFIGRSKGRLNRIIKAYDILSNAGLKCYFYVVGENRISKYKNIIFTDKIMPYGEMLEKTINSRCVLELSQDKEYGFTSRSQEAIIYNKKLITDSLIVKEQKFYPSKDILFINDVADINPDFVKEMNEVDYGYNGEYSPLRMIENIEAHLV